MISLVPAGPWGELASRELACSPAAMRDSTRLLLLNAGKALVISWCAANGVPAPAFREYGGRQPDFGTCAYYRDNVVHIWPLACAALGLAGRCWSWPGYVVDRTPYGVCAHELAHHVDDAAGAAGGTLSHLWLRETREPQLTGYAPNANEWFAEHFRLFLTNPDLLSLLRPRVFELMLARWPQRVEQRSWALVIGPGGERQMGAALNKLRLAMRQSGATHAKAIGNRLNAHPPYGCAGVPA